MMSLPNVSHVYYTYIHTYICTHILTHICTYTHTHICTYTCIHICMYIQVAYFYMYSYVTILANYIAVLLTQTLLFLE